MGRLPGAWAPGPGRLKLLALTRPTGLDPRGHGCTGQAGHPV